MSKSSWKLKIEEIAKRDRMEKKKTNEWKDLDIKDIPSDFFVNDEYETECYGSRGIWTNCMNDFKNKIAMVEIIHDMNETFKYRYRLKSLEPIRITKKLIDYIVPEALSHGETMDKIEKISGRKVEIID